MDTKNYLAWKALLNQRDLALYGLLFLAVALVGSYLITYVEWLPAKYGKVIRYTYEIGGLLLYIGIVIVCVIGSTEINP